MAIVQMEVSAVIIRFSSILIYNIVQAPVFRGILDHLVDTLMGVKYDDVKQVCHDPAISHISCARALYIPIHI